MRTPEAVAGMLCPICKVGLMMSDRQGIEIDYCPNCRGIWLDRGELDKIIERSGAEVSVPPPPQTPPPTPGYAPPPPAQPWGGERRYEERGYDQRGYGQQGYGGHHGKKRKKSFLEELFD
jgi:Zn-finger nucleic acid-binding protein